MQQDEQREREGCPYCGEDTLVPSDAPGIFRCGGCGRSVLAPTLHDPARRVAPPGARRRRRTRRAPGEVAAWPAALAALVLTVGFYLFLGALPGGRLTQLFLERGSVPYVITGVSAWALCLLAARAWQLRTESRAFRIDPFELAAGERLTRARVAGVLERLALRREQGDDGFLAARLERALRHFQSRGRVAEVVDVLAAESAADEGRVEASYALIRVFVWAVPTLGFIGTVIGIGGAVGGFSETLEAAASLDAMKESIGTVTAGLGVAFDTTLLALVMSILIMFPANAVQRVEEELVAAVDDYCVEQLVLRLDDDAAPDDAAVEALAQRIFRQLRAASDAES
jgi:biopolymer transport protein ExbB/TolQ/ribosomal protein L37AE/L43A